MRKVRKGFTLIELLIVIAVLGALTAMVQLSSGKAAASARAASIVSGLQTMRTAVGIYIAENAAGEPKIETFKGKVSEYTDDAVTRNAANFVYLASGDDKIDNQWYVGYKLSGAEATTDVKAKLSERASNANLKGGKDTAATADAYTSEDVVFLRVH